MILQLVYIRIFRGIYVGFVMKSLLQEEEHFYNVWEYTSFHLRYPIFTQFNNATTRSTCNFVLPSTVLPDYRQFVGLKWWSLSIVFNTIIDFFFIYDLEHNHLFENVLVATLTYNKTSELQLNKLSLIRYEIHVLWSCFKKRVVMTRPTMWAT